MPSISQSWVVTGLAALTLYLGLFWNGLAVITGQSTGLYAAAYIPPPAVTTPETAPTAKPTP
jgi:hypothetical protein